MLTREGIYWISIEVLFFILTSADLYCPVVTLPSDLLRNTPKMFLAYLAIVDAAKDLAQPDKEIFIGPMRCSGLGGFLLDLFIYLFIY